MKRVMVTGATGFVGRHTLQHLVEKGYEVHAVALNALPEFDGNVTFHATNLLDERSVVSLIEQVSPSHLLHFAWCAKPGEYWNSLENYSWVKATITLMEEFSRCGGQRAVFAGSCAEYDWAQDVSCVSESAPCAGSSAYTICKNALHQILSSYSERTGISFAWGRIFHMFGPYEYPDRLVPYVIRSLLCETDADCSEGKQIRDFMDVQCVGSAFAALLDSSVNGTVNVASGNPISLRDLISRIQLKMGVGGVINFGARPSPKNEPDRLVADTTRLNREVGWQSGKTLDQSIDLLVDWWRLQLIEEERNG